MSWLLDTNILCRIARPDDPQHADARNAVLSLLSQGEDLAITPQIMREFWVVATRPRDRNGLGMTPVEAAAMMDAMCAFAGLREEDARIHCHWLSLVLRFDVTSKQAHDACHVAAMQAHGIENILTFDRADFARFDGLVRVRTPPEVTER